MNTKASVMTSSPSRRSRTEFPLRTFGRGYDLAADVILIGDDILVAIHGGDKPHIGAVAVAQPRPSLRDPEVTSATASVICYVGHKEDEMAKSAAEALAAALGKRVVVTAGIHWDDLSEEGIRRIRSNGDAIVDLILTQIRDEKRKQRNEENGNSM